MQASETSVENNFKMSSLYFVFMCLGALVANTFAITQEEITKLREVMRPIVSSCADQYGITLEQVIEARKAGTIEQLNPCLSECVFKKTGVINDKGLYDADIAIEKSKKYVTDPAEVEKINTIHKACIAVNDAPVGDSKDCERAKLLLSCLVKHKGDFSTIAV
uniref:Odorant Binding Protein 7 n=1 Tax=Dendrolimus punctatus TaxID=238572 RepID=A0A2K8GKH2_9NEOP|nr:Odorant Binding Protein 7 [Dendrolimus punctatus]